MLLFSNPDIEEVDHLFICSGWHHFNDMYPFFQSLNRPNKYYFSDTGNSETFSMEDFDRFTSKRKKVILYFSSLKLEAIVSKLLKIYDEIKFVRLFHGIAGPWAKFIQSPSGLVDVVVAASELDADFVRRYSNYRVEIIGWPKGENFYNNNCLHGKPIISNSVLVASNWTKERGDLRICDYINDLSGLDRTFMIHPRIELKCSTVRVMPPEYTSAQFKKMDPALVKVVRCPRGVLEHMSDKTLLMGVVSSSSFEWLLFNRPILFLKKSEYLNFGPVLDYSGDIRKQILGLLDGPDGFSYLRELARSKLMSHFDGQYATRFNDMIGDLERQFIPPHVFFLPSVSGRRFATLEH